MRLKSTAVAAMAGAITLAAAGITPASAATLSRPIASGLAGPLQFAVGNQGTIIVAQDFAGVLTAINGTRKDLVNNHGREVAGVAITNGSILFTAGGVDGGPPVASLNRYTTRGGARQIADLYAFEKSKNPDHGQTYGFFGLSQQCKRQLPPDFGPVQYNGIVDSHAYSVTEAHGTNYVADAAGNDILTVSNSGAVKALTVLPPQPSTISAAAAKANHLPACVVGHSYHFEPVPTDVEMAADGYLYVSTLPGGPEDPSLGARGSVYRINPRTGAAIKVATGLLGGANIAVTPQGVIYVSEIFANRVSRIVNGKPVAVVSLPSPSGLEYAHGKVYVSYNVFDNGMISTINV